MSMLKVPNTNTNTNTNTKVPVLYRMNELDILE